MKTILKPMLAMGVVVMSLLITATSCDKEPAAGGGSGGNNSGNNLSGRTGDLKLEAKTDAASIVKIKDNTVYINAAELANKLTPLSKANDNQRSFDDITDADDATGKSTSYVESLFDVVYDNAQAVMIFVNRAHVTKDTITLRADGSCTGNGEKNDNDRAKAAGGGICRPSINNLIFFDSQLGTVFDNAKTTSHARGKMMCGSGLVNLDSENNFLPITDTLIFNRANLAACTIGVVNNGLSTGAEIDDAWATDTDSTTEVELYALAVDVTGKTIPEFSSAAGFNRSEFAKELDNAAFKKILEKNQWRDLRFKVKIVTAANF